MYVHEGQEDMRTCPRCNKAWSCCRALGMSLSDTWLAGYLKIDVSDRVTAHRLWHGRKAGIIFADMLLTIKEEGMVRTICFMLLALIHCLHQLHVH
jgi:hypothetical protein